MNVRIWTFFRVGQGGNPEGIYDERYERAAREGIDRTSGGTFRAEFIHDGALPEFLRYRGWWCFMQCFNPRARVGNTGGVVYCAGLDTVFLRDLPRLVAALDEVGADVAGVPCPSDGEYNSFVFRVRRGTPGANAVWQALIEDKHRHAMEHIFVRQNCPSLGVIPPELVVSYKAEAGVSGRRQYGTDGACAIAFHGRPRPHEIDGKGPLQQLVVENWKP